MRVRSNRHLQELVDDERFEDLLAEVGSEYVAEAWIAYQNTAEHPRDPAEDLNWWAIDLWMSEAWWSDEPRVRDGILRLVDAARTDADFGVLGAAVMEDFIVDDEDRVAWVERHAAASEPFRRALANVWISDCSDWVFERVERAAGVMLARPTGPAWVSEDGLGFVAHGADQLVLKMMAEGHIPEAVGAEARRRLRLGDQPGDVLVDMIDAVGGLCGEG